MTPFQGLTEVNNYLEISTCNPFKVIMDTPIRIVFIYIEK